MASELYPLPQGLMNNLTDITANTTLDSNQITNVSSVIGLVEEQFVFSDSNVFPAGTYITYVNPTTNTVTLSNNALSTKTALNISVRVLSYSTESVYNAVPEFIQNLDGQNGYPLYAFIFGVGTILDQQTNVLSRDNVGTLGSFDTAYLGAPGWSQLLDIDRCPTFALRWLGQMVGVRLPIGLSRDEMIARIKNRSGFQRGTVGSARSVMTKLLNNTGITPAAVESDVIVMEQVAWNSTTSKYEHDDYSATILVPKRFFSQYTYTSLNTAVGNAQVPPTTSPNYTQTNAFIGSAYSNISGTLTPSTSSSFSVPFSPYRPAGIRVFIGGY